MGKVIEYYTIHCPKCKTLQMLMDKKKIAFNVIDDKDTVMSVADTYGIKEAPFAIIDGQFYGTKQLQEWIKEQ